MSTIEVLPEGLASTPPGPVLGSALASMDPSRYESVDLFGMVALQAKQVAFEQSRLLAMMLEAAYAYGGDVALAKAAVAKATVAKATSPDGLPDADGGGVGVPARVRELDEFSADQLAFSLVWSRVTAQAHLFTAKDLIERLPVVYAALRAGRIDLPRARVFSDGLACLDDVKAQEIAALLIEKAEELTPGQLREKVHYRVIKADPSLVRKRYDRCVTDRSLYNQPYADGTSHLSAVNLPPDKAAAAYSRVDRIARAAKSSGDVRTLP